MKNICIGAIFVLETLVMLGSSHVYAEPALKVTGEDKRETDDFKSVRLALDSYISAVRKHEERTLIDIKAHEFSSYLGSERLLKIVTIGDNYKRLFGLYDRLRAEKIDVSDGGVLQIGNTPRDVLFISAPGFLLDVKKLSEYQNLNNVEVSYEVVSHGDEDQKVWEDLRYTANFYFYKNSESKWMLNAVIYREKETGKFWTLDGSIAKMDSINFNTLATAWEKLLSR